MNVLSNSNEDCPNNLISKQTKNLSNDYYSSMTMINFLNINNRNYQHHFVNIINNENENKFITASNELSASYNEEPLINIQTIPDQNLVSNEQNETKKNNVDYFSEIMKFKTELCHSWELTGSCKYGVNVSFYDLIFFHLL